MTAGCHYTKRSARVGFTCANMEVEGAADTRAQDRDTLREVFENDVCLVSYPCECTARASLHTAGQAPEVKLGRSRRWLQVSRSRAAGHPQRICSDDKPDTAISTMSPHRRPAQGFGQNVSHINKRTALLPRSSRGHCTRAALSVLRPCFALLCSWTPISRGPLLQPGCCRARHASVSTCARLSSLQCKKNTQHRDCRACSARATWSVAAETRFDVTQQLHHALPT
jgi:hypothetical protein